MDFSERSARGDQLRAEIGIATMLEKALEERDVALAVRERSVEASLRQM